MTQAKEKPPVTRFDAVIVGAGMVGAALAGLLAEAGMQVALVEAKASTLHLDDVAGEIPAPRVSALTPVSQRLLTHLGAWPAMQTARVTPYRYMEVWDAEGSGHIRFSADEAGTAVLGHIVENDVTLAALNEQVAKQPTLTRLNGVRVEALQTTARGRWLVLDDGRQLQTPLLVAADGARSALRALAGISVAEEPMAQEAVVTTVRCAQPHGATARQAFIAGRPLAFLPLTVDGDDRYCSIVWSTTPEHAQALTRHAQHYVQPNFALVGDAAHSLHPLAGQGVNLGLMDAAVLAEEVVLAWRRGAPWGSVATLRRYERRRRFDNSAMLGLMKGFKGLFGSQHPVFTLARNVGMSGMNQLVPLKRLVMRQATGERGRLPLSCR